MIRRGRPRAAGGARSGTALAALRRLAPGAAVVGAALALVIAGAPPALAHGLGGRIDLPVPRWLFVWGASAALVVSFVALGALWREPRLEGRADPPGRDGPLQRVLTSPAVEWAVRLVALAWFLFVAVAGIAGADDPTANLAPVAVYVWAWVGLAFACALLGNLWATLSPFDTLARALGIGERPRWEYPRWLGTWPAAAFLFAFVWLELVAPFGARPRVLGLAAAGYAAATLGGMAAFGREAWQRNGEAFAVLYDLLGRLAPLGRDAEGRVVLRPPLGGLPALEPRPGLLAFVMTSLGSTTFDGLSRSSAWITATGRLPEGIRVLAGTAGLVGTILAVAAAYALAMAAAAAIGRRSWHPLSVRFAHSLVPIAFAYVAAHYFSLLFLEGQLGVILLSDPFGRGWDLLGTAGWRVDLGLLSPTTIWYVQVAAVIAGHVGGVVLAHDRAVATFPGRLAVRTQYALLAVMVLFTVTALVLLSGG